VGEIGDRAMPVLEIKSIEEFFGFLGGDLPERLLHRERRARILRHGVGLDFRLDAIDGEDLYRRSIVGSGVGRRWHGLGGDNFRHE
jgi:hypothetical protein